MNYLLLIIIGQFISLVGSSIQTTAIPLYILETTQSGLMVSISQIITIVVTVIVSPFAGVLGDRFNRKKVLVFSDLASGAMILVLFGIFTAKVGNVAFLFLCQALCTASECTLLASLLAIIVDLVPNDKVARANAMRSIATNTALFIGPIIGGALFGLLGMRFVLLINAASFFISAAFAMGIRYQRTVQPVAAPVSLRSMVGDIREAVAYIRQNDYLKRLLKFTVIMNMADAPVVNAILPFLVMTVIHMTSQDFGVIQGLFMGGFIAGGFVLSVIKIKRVNRLVRPALLTQCGVTLAFSLASLPLLLAFTGNVFVISALMMVIGFSNSISSTVVLTEIQLSVRPDMMSRVGGAMNMAFQASMPLGLLAVGLLLDRLPVYFIFIPLAAFLLIFVALSSNTLFTGKAAGANTGAAAENPY